MIELWAKIEVFRYMIEAIIIIICVIVLIILAILQRRNKNG